MIPNLMLLMKPRNLWTELKPPVTSLMGIPILKLPLIRPTMTMIVLKVKLQPLLAQETMLRVTMTKLTHSIQH